MLLSILLQDWYGIISSSLAAVLLLGSSTLVAIILIIQSELEMQTMSLLVSTAAAHTKSSKNSLPSGSKKMSIKTTTTVATSSESSHTGSITPSNASNSPSSASKKPKLRHQHYKQRTIKLTNLSTSGVKSVVGLSWLLPLLCAMCIPLIHSIIGYWPPDWWLEIRSFDFVIFIIIEALFVFLFFLLFITLMKKLLYYSRKYEKLNSSLRKR